MEHKLIVENWRKFLIEAETEGPTVAQFLETFGTSHPKAASKILGQAARWLVAGAVGATVGAGASALAGPAGFVAGAYAGKVADEKITEWMMKRVSSKSKEFAQFMVDMSENQVPDDQRTGLALYYDLDDEYEALLQGMDSELANAYQKSLFDYFDESLGKMMSIEDPTKVPLSKHIDQTANEYLKTFLLDKQKSNVGVAVAKPQQKKPVGQKI